MGSPLYPIQDRPRANPALSAPVNLSGVSGPARTVLDSMQRRLDQVERSLTTTLQLNASWQDLIPRRFAADSSVTTKSASFTASAEIQWYRVSASSGAVTATVPLAINSPGRTIGYIKTDSSSNAVTLTASGSDTIRGATTLILGAQYAAVIIKSDGISAWDVSTTNWAFGSGDNVLNEGLTTVGQLLDIREGTSASPDTTDNPVVKISRTMERSVGNNDYRSAALNATCLSTASCAVQAVGVLGAAYSNSTQSAANDDACGGFFIGIVQGSGTGTGIGAYIEGKRTTTTGNANGLEVRSANYTASAGSYNSTGFSNTSGLWVCANGTALSDSGVGLAFGNPFGLQFKVGIGFTAQVTAGLTGAVADSSIRDDGNSTTSLDIRGTHTTALNVASGAGAVNLLNNVTLGDTDGADTLTIRAGTWTISNNYTATRSAGALAAGTNNIAKYDITGSGDSGGTTTALMHVTTAATTGANAFTAVQGHRKVYTHSGSATVTTGTAVHGIALITSTGNVTSGRVFATEVQLTSSGSATTMHHFRANAPTLSSTGAITTHTGFVSGNMGHATLVTNAIGHDAEDITASATLAAGFRSQVTSGTAKWGFYASGTANNAFSGNVRIGSVTAPTVALDVTGSAIFSGDVTAGDGSADTLTINAGTWTLGSNYTATRSAGTVATGVVDLITYNTSATGDSGGASNIRANLFTHTTNGANAISSTTAVRPALVHSGTATLSNGIASSNSVTISNSGNVTAAVCVNTSFSLTSSGGATTATCFNAGAPTLSSTGAITTHNGFLANDLGHATLVSNAHGFNCTDMTAAATLTAAFRSQMTSGTGKWGFYASGSANNGFVGKTIFGTVSTTPVSAVHIQDSSTGWIVQDELDANPTTSELDANDSIAIYSKANTFVIAFNNAGTMTYATLALDGSATTWAQSTSAP